MSLENIDLDTNPEPRCPCVLLLDTSGSMSGERIARLNEGVRLLKETLASDDVASKRVEVAIVTFESSVKVVQDFATADGFDPPTLTTGGSTSMGAGILKALEIVRERKKDYNERGILYYRPWVFMITDGSPTDDIEQAARAVRTDEESKRVSFFAVGVEGADMDKLKTIALRAPLKLKGLNFADMFLWLSASLQQVSHSNTGDQVALAPPGWGYA